MNNCTHNLLSIPVICFLAVAMVLNGNATVHAAPSESQPVKSGTLPEKLTTNHLPNAVRVHEKVISGGLPENEKAFAELAELGVKTIISVDGQIPNAVAAKKFGMRYVHLPHGYNGIPTERVKELAKAVHDLPGPIYIHCHHGKHRSPAAASVACVAAGMIPNSEAVNVLKIAGTSPNYRGLFQSAMAVSKLEGTELDNLQVTFRERMPTPPLVETMVAIEHCFDHLKKIQQANWTVPLNHPDLDSSHEALLLKEHFRELYRLEELPDDVEYSKLLKESETAASNLEHDIRKWKLNQLKNTPPVGLNQHMLLLSQNCKTCHQKYRDVPLDANSLQ